MTGVRAMDMQEDLALRSEIIGPGLGPSTERIQQLAQRDLPTLIVGETGTGKELLAREYFQAWRAATGKERFATVNCTGFSEDLLRAELFGHVKGSFTGATADKQGLVEAHDLICLDELGDAGRAFQAQLLRVVEYREFLPVGAQRVERCNARFIASTNRRRGIRADLVERFHHIYVPPLALRGDDIVALVEQHGKDLGVKWVTARFVEWASVYPWPGNVRELKRCLGEATINGVLDLPQVPWREMPEALYRSIRQTKVKGPATLALADFGKAFRAHRPDPARIELNYLAATRERKDSRKAHLARIAQELEKMNTERLFTRSYRPGWRPVGYANGSRRPRTYAETQARNSEKNDAIAALREAGSVRAYAEQLNLTVRTVSQRLNALGIDAQASLKGYAKRRRVRENNL